MLKDLCMHSNIGIFSWDIDGNPRFLSWILISVELLTWTFNFSGVNTIGTNDVTSNKRIYPRRRSHLIILTTHRHDTWPASSAFTRALHGFWLASGRCSWCQQPFTISTTAACYPGIYKERCPSTNKISSVGFCFSNALLLCLCLNFCFSRLYLIFQRVLLQRRKLGKRRVFARINGWWIVCSA